MAVSRDFAAAFLQVHFRNTHLSLRSPFREHRAILTARRPVHRATAGLRPPLWAEIVWRCGSHFPCKRVSPTTAG
jgi:hypothetical protein